MKLEKLTYENTAKFLNELLSECESKEIRHKEALRIAVKHGFTPAYKILADAINIGFFRIDNCRYVCLKQYFPVQTTLNFIYYLAEHSLYDHFCFHSRLGGKKTYEYYLYKHQHDNPVEHEFEVFLLSLPISEVMLSSVTRRHLDKNGIMIMRDLLQHYKNTKVINPTVKKELKTLHDIYSKLDLIY